MKIIEKILSIINESDKLRNSQSPEIETTLTGYSGKRIINLLKDLSLLFSQLEDNTCYLEVGVFQGLTLLSVANYVPNMPCYGIDNFAFFDPDKKNLGIIETRRKKLNVKNAYIINSDYEDALENLQEVIGDKKIGVYFIDGPHDYRSQLMCLQLAMPFLHENAVIVVDDCNYCHVRQANRDFLVTHPQFKLLFQVYTRSHPNNMEPKQREQEAENGWWNGINVIVRDPDRTIEPIFPSTSRDRKLYENEHLIHSYRLAKAVPELIELAQKMVDEKNPIKFLVRLSQVWIKLVKANKIYKDRYTSMNTDSENLTTNIAVLK